MYILVNVLRQNCMKISLKVNKYNILVIYKSEMKKSILW
jgi:hypothetical protein